MGGVLRAVSVVISSFFFLLPLLLLCLFLAANDSIMVRSTDLVVATLLMFDVGDGEERALDFCVCAFGAIVPTTKR